MGDNGIKYGRFIHFICTGAVSIRLTAFPLTVKITILSLMGLSHEIFGTFFGLNRKIWTKKRPATAKDFFEVSNYISWSFIFLDLVKGTIA